MDDSSDDPISIQNIILEQRITAVIDAYNRNNLPQTIRAYHELIGFGSNTQSIPNTFLKDRLPHQLYTYLRSVECVYAVMVGDQKLAFEIYREIYNLGLQDFIPKDTKKTLDILFQQIK